MDGNQQMKLLESVTNYFGLKYIENGGYGENYGTDENNNGFDRQISQLNQKVSQKSLNRKLIGQNLTTGQNFHQKSNISIGANVKNQELKLKARIDAILRKQNKPPTFVFDVICPSDTLNDSPFCSVPNRLSMIISGKLKNLNTQNSYTVRSPTVISKFVKSESWQVETESVLAYHVDKSKLETSTNKNIDSIEPNHDLLEQTGLNDILELSLLLNQVIYEIDRENFLEMDFSEHQNFIHEDKIQIVRLNVGDRLSGIFKFLRESKSAFSVVVCLSDSIQFPGEEKCRQFSNVISEEDVEKADSKGLNENQFVYAVKESSLAYILK